MSNLINAARKLVAEQTLLQTKISNQVAICQEVITDHGN